MANSFEAELQQSAAALGLTYLKIPIAHKLCRQGPKTFLLPLQENPYDGFLIGAGGIHVALELKSQAEFGSFPLSRVADHQVHGLQTAIAAGARAYLLINMRREMVKRARPKAGAGAREAGGELVSRPNNRAWAVDFRWWEELRALLRDRKSLPAEAFVTGAGFPGLTTLPRVPGPEGTDGLVWDLRVLTG
jgi:hypothetical protein